MTVTALLIGGPDHGTQYVMKKYMQTIKTSEIQPTNINHPNIIDPLGMATYKTHLYIERMLSFFGSPLRVYVHESLQTGPSGDEIVAHLFLELLMNDLGKQLLQEMQ